MAAEDSAARALASKGSKLHTHELHIRRTKNGYIAKHHLADDDGNPPTDGQSASAEYNIANPSELSQHVQEHMGSNAQAEMDTLAGDKA